MTLREGDRVPDATFVTMEGDGPVGRTTTEVFSGRNVAIFGLPGAYTPVCHREHLPGIVELHDVMTQQGIEVVACTAVNDVFVLDKWSKDLNAAGKVVMLADGNADFAVKCGLAIDMTRYGLGIRSNRYAMLVADGVVTMLCVEDAIMDHSVSSASALCQRAEAQNPQSATG